MQNMTGIASHILHVPAATYLPGGCPPSIVGTSELNFRVRNGNGWNLTVIDTGYGVCK